MKQNRCVLVGRMFKTYSIFVQLFVMFYLSLNYTFASDSFDYQPKLTVYPSVPEPGQKVALRVNFTSSSLQTHGMPIKVSDVFGKEIASKDIPAGFPLPLNQIDIPFYAPPYPGKYSYNVKVAVGDRERFVNIPVSSIPVTSVTVTELAVLFRDNGLGINFELKNNGNQDLNNIKVSAVLNPSLERFYGKDMSESAVGEMYVQLLGRDNTMKVEMQTDLRGRQLLYDKEKNRFTLAILISGIGGLIYSKVEQFEIKNDTPMPIPLHSLPAHTFYTENAKDVFPVGSPLYQELSLYRQQLIDGSYNEDYPPDLVYGETWPFLYIHHFLDYDNHPFYSGLSGTGLYIPLITSNYVESAYEKAMAYWEGWTSDGEYHPGAVELYLGIGLPYPDKITAYEYVGRIAHLIEDMLTPAHVHSDMHGIPFDDDEFEEVYEPGIDPNTGRPRYEKYDEKSAVWAYWGGYIGNRNFTDFAELFTKINNHTDYFPSDEVEGDDANFSNPWNIPKLYRTNIIYYDFFGFDHYKLPGMQNLSDWVSPLNVMSVAAIYKFFWDNTH